MSKTQNFYFQVANVEKMDVKGKFEDVEGEEGDLQDILDEIVDGEDADEEEDDVDSDVDSDDLGGWDDDQDYETRSRFTEYSMSSSVVPRSEQMVILDDKFEKVRKYWW